MGDQFHKSVGALQLNNISGVVGFGKCLEYFDISLHSENQIGVLHTIYLEKQRHNVWFAFLDFGGNIHHFKQCYFNKSTVICKTTSFSWKLELFRKLRLQ